ncbi:uncharacterized protein [Paramisgurnus dabryanus]|uniref:uncharacterized protein isoform X2 n=1 Tax=Paramisgurnus dabryanus TaxID=90735 RepID=UPI0031F3D8DC
MYLLNSTPKNQCLLVLLLLPIQVVFNDKTQEQKSVDVSLSVTEEESVTLESAVTEIQRNDLILWTYGDTRIAQMNKETGKISLYDGDNGMFRGKLHLNSQTGSLTITNISTEHTGVYRLEMISSGLLSKTFRVTVSAFLPIPVITRDSTQSPSSGSQCVLLCSVLNVRDVSLSWYKGNSLLSSISVSDLNIRLSLPLEVEYQDTNTYSCVLNNPFRNQTQHLNITHLCQIITSAHGLHPGYIALICVLCGTAFAAAVVGIYCKCKSGKAVKKAQPAAEELDNLTNGRETLNQVANLQNGHLIQGDQIAEPDDVEGATFIQETNLQNNLNAEDKVDQLHESSLPWIDDDAEKTSNQKTDSKNSLYPEEEGDRIDDDVITMLTVTERESVTLHTGITTVKEDEEIEWKFAESRVIGQVQFKVIVLRTKTPDGEFLFSNDERFKDRLQLDNQTGSLTITNMTTEDNGHYKLLISKKEVLKTFNVAVIKRVSTIKRSHTN